MKELLSILNSIHSLSPELQCHLLRILKERKVAKKEYLLKEGHVCRSIWFIQQVMVRCFYIKGKHDVSSWFMQEGDVIISVESFFDQRPSYESIQASKDCVILH